MIIYGAVMANCIENDEYLPVRQSATPPLARYTRVEPTDAYFKMYPKSRNRVKLGIIVGYPRNSEGYRVQWDGQVMAKTVSPRLIKAVPYDSKDTTDGR